MTEKTLTWDDITVKRYLCDDFDPVISPETVERIRRKVSDHMSDSLAYLIHGLRPQAKSYRTRKTGARMFETRYNPETDSYEVVV